MSKRYVIYVDSDMFRVVDVMEVSLGFLNREDVYRERLRDGRYEEIGFDTIEEAVLWLNRNVDREYIDERCRI